MLTRVDLCWYLCIRIDLIVFLSLTFLEVNNGGTIYCTVIQKTMSPRKSKEDVMTKFCQKQSFADILQNRISQISQENTCVGVSF